MDYKETTKRARGCSARLWCRMVSTQCSLVSFFVIHFSLKIQGLIQK